ncbi:hypothetical protein BHE74_00029460 [Ensete ventricosum]|nr:hypothetical protein GW17_00000277 [Ensete ventricosum]RWW63368.1 hypothetical protein BHE74_00029460 [Ensete ventricosum]
MHWSHTERNPLALHSVLPLSSRKPQPLASLFATAAAQLRMHAGRTHRSSGRGQAVVADGPPDSFLHRISGAAAAASSLCTHFVSSNNVSLRLFPQHRPVAAAAMNALHHPKQAPLFHRKRGPG